MGGWSVGRGGGGGGGKWFARPFPSLPLLAIMPSRVTACARAPLGSILVECLALRCLLLLRRCDGEREERERERAKGDDIDTLPLSGASGLPTAAGAGGRGRTHQTNQPSPTSTSAGPVRNEAWSRARKRARAQSTAAAAEAQTFLGLFLRFAVHRGPLKVSQFGSRRRSEKGETMRGRDAGRLRFGGGDLERKPTCIVIVNQQ